MRCPFELPVTAEYSKISDAYIVIDPHDKVIAYNCNKESSDYIVQAINSHEKLVEATKALVEDRDTLQQDEGIFACQCLAKAPDDTTEPPPCCYCLGKQALKEAGEP